MDPHLLPDILIFLSVARSGSITKAANHLNTVQSNVTARIKKLEEALGVPLLSRHARGVRLTSGGEAVLPMALRLDALLNDLGYAFGRRMPSFLEQLGEQLPSFDERSRAQISFL
jgi:DNA-binding transcriptional LysR family regulator